MDDFERLRERVADLGAGADRRFPAVLRDDLVAAIARQRSAGVHCARIAETLGISLSTVRRWSPGSAASHRRKRRAPKSESASRALVPVAETRVAAGIAVVAPSGIRIEGLDVESAIQVARALG